MVRLTRESDHASMMESDLLVDANADLVLAIQHANTILGWYENLPEEEMPERWMWPFPEELEEWFDEVKAARDRKYGRDRGDDYAEMDSNAWRPGDDLD